MGGPAIPGSAAVDRADPRPRATLLAAPDGRGRGGLEPGADPDRGFSRMGTRYGARDGRVLSAIRGCYRRVVRGGWRDSVARRTRWAALGQHGDARDGR